MAIHRGAPEVAEKMTEKHSGLFKLDLDRLNRVSLLRLSIPLSMPRKVWWDGEQRGFKQRVFVEKTNKRLGKNEVTGDRNDLICRCQICLVEAMELEWTADQTSTHSVLLTSIEVKGTTNFKIRQKIRSWTEKTYSNWHNLNGSKEAQERERERE